MKLRAARQAAVRLDFSVQMNRNGTERDRGIEQRTAAAADTNTHTVAREGRRKRIVSTAVVEDRERQFRSGLPGDPARVGFDRHDEIAAAHGRPPRDPQRQLRIVTVLPDSDGQAAVESRRRRGIREVDAKLKNPDEERIGIEETRVEDGRVVRIQDHALQDFAHGAVPDRVVEQVLHGAGGNGEHRDQIEHLAEDRERHSLRVTGSIRERDERKGTAEIPARHESAGGVRIA